MLTSREKKNKKEIDAYNSSFVSNEDKDDNIKTSDIASFMLKDSIIENEREGYLPTEREGDDDDDGGSIHTSASKFDDSVFDVDNSIMQMEDSICDDLDSSRGALQSPSKSPRGR